MAFLFLWAAVLLSAQPQPAPLRVLVLTGGHPFDQEAFFAMFPKMQGVQITHAEFTKGAEAKLTPAARNNFDVMLFYDMHQNPEPHWDSWQQLLEAGMPSVFLHHALGSYGKKFDHLDIVGGHARFTTKAGSARISTLYTYDQQLKIHVADPDHPITRGVKDFTILDEAYRGSYIRPDVHVLLTTEHPANDTIVAWTHKYKNSPIVYLQLGHDKNAYENPNFLRLLEQSLRWAASEGGK